MDVAVDLLDPYVFEPMYQHFPEIFASKDYWGRQLFSSWLLLWIGGSLMYLFFASLNYVFTFDRSLRKEKRFLKNQELMEIAVSLKSIPIMGIFSAPIVLAEIRGYSQLHEEPIEGVKGFFSVTFTVIAYLLFTDMLIYFIHRGLHHPLIYPYVHKLHHKWVVSTPFASHAFHPLDGFAQSTPYHIFVFLFPLNKWLYVILFVFVNFWTISIHDGKGIYQGQILNGANHHTIHHRQFNYNYGQYFTLWDRLCGTHRLPTERNIWNAEKPHGFNKGD